MGALLVMLRLVVCLYALHAGYLVFHADCFQCRVLDICCSDLSEMSCVHCRHEGVSSGRVIFLAVRCGSSNACVCLYGVEMIVML